MKIVLDTNVFVSGIFFSGPPARILRAWHDGGLNLILSPEILDEYQRVGTALAEQFPAIDLGPILKLVTVKAEMVAAPALSEALCSDLDDDKFFACALAARCPVIVSGDKHLLQVSGYGGVTVLKPRAFVDGYLYEREA